MSSDWLNSIHSSDALYDIESVLGSNPRHSNPIATTEFALMQKNRFHITSELSDFNIVRVIRMIQA